MKIKSTLLLTFLVLFFAVRAQQPTNGGFDTWTQPANPDGWVTLNNLAGLQSGVFASQDLADKVSGTSSLKMIADTIPGASQFGVVFGLASLGTGTLGGNGPSFQGVPFTARPDTLSFDYKHSSTGGADTGRIQIALTAHTSAVLQVSYNLVDKASWTHVVLPLTGAYLSNTTPDTLLLQVQTSVGQALRGTELQVDNIKFGYVTRTAPSGVYTLGSENIGSLNFNLYGAINSNGNASVYSFVYSTDSTFATSSVVTPAQNLTDDSLEVVWAKISGLSPATKYFYYIKDSSSAGVKQGVVMSFLSTSGSYTFTNAGADVYGTNFAQMNGLVHGLSGSTVLSFIYGVDPDHLDSIKYNVQTVTDTNRYYVSGQWQPSGNVIPNQTFFFRLMGINGTDTMYSDIKCWFNGTPYTTLITPPVSNVTSTSVTINATVQGFPLPFFIASELDNQALNSYVHYTPAYYDYTTSVVNFTHQATGLVPDQYYGVRVGVKTWIGNFYADTAVTTLTAGINYIAGSENDVHVYPNPANNFLTVHLDVNLNESVKGQLFNLNGQFVKELLIPANQNNYTLTTGELESGVYLLRLISGNIMYNKKITIVK